MKNNCRSTLTRDYQGSPLGKYFKPLPNPHQTPTRHHGYGFPRVRVRVDVGYTGTQQVISLYNYSIIWALETYASREPHRRRPPAASVAAPAAPQGVGGGQFGGGYTSRGGGEGRRLGRTHSLVF